MPSAAPVVVRIARVDRAGPQDPALAARGPTPQRASAEAAGFDLLAWIPAPLSLAPGESSSSTTLTSCSGQSMGTLMYAVTPRNGPPTA